MPTLRNGINGHPDDNEEEEEERQLPYLFEKELIENSNKHIHLFDHFQSTKKRCPPIERKPHVRHEQRQPHYIQHLGRVDVSQEGRRDSAGYPLLESQVYGWWPKSLEQRRRQNSAERKALDLNAIVAPKRRCDMTIHGEYLQCERQTERAKFYGLRFSV